MADSITSLGFNPLNADNSLFNPNATTVNIAEIRIPVNACVNDIGVIIFNIQDDMVIANAIAGSIIGKNKIDLPNSAIPEFANVFINFPIPNDITVNIPAINMEVIACPRDIGVTIFNIQDDIAIANAIAGSIIGRYKIDLPNSAIPDLSKSLINFPIPNDIAVKIPAINIEVIA
jgi:hypothetical protein